MSSTEQAIRGVLAEQAHLPVDATTLPREADLFEAGMTSHASVNVMLGLEDAFDLEFPDHMLERSVFASVAALEAALSSIRAEEAA